MLDSTDTLNTDNRQIHTFQPMGLGGILDATLSLYRENLRLFLGIAAIYFLLIALQEGVIVFLLERSGTPRLDNFISDVDSVSDTFIGILIIGVSVVACSDLYLGKPVTIQVALRRFISLFVEYLGASWIYLILCCVVWTLDPFGESALVNLLRLAFLPFLCFYLVSWVLYGPVVLNEEFTGQQALERSKLLVRGTWGRVFGIVLAIILFCLAIEYILGGTLGVVLALFGIARDGSLMETVVSLLGMKYIVVRPTSMFLLIMYLIYLGVETFTLPIYAIGVTLLYFDLRIRKEGFDIEMQVRNSQDLM